MIAVLDRPVLARQWDPVRNARMDPAQVSCDSARVAWWVCAEGHQWPTKIRDRSRPGDPGCPVCFRRPRQAVAALGEKSLSGQRSDLAAQWNHDLNDIGPDQVAPASNYRAWWTCTAGHSWQARVATRTASATGCPVCSNKRVVAGINDLATTHPHLALQWHPRNALEPISVVAGTKRKAWWSCPAGHEWEAEIRRRAHRGHGCPTCRTQAAGA